jgi:L-asparaginase
VAKINQKLVVLGTGGTIAGTAASSADHTGYTAAQIGVAQLLQGIAGLPEALQGCQLVAEQVAQIDSKDMDFATMAHLAARCAYWLGQGDVAAIVVTHGTDTLEETAWFLHLTLPADMQVTKPVVLTCAMRPATSSEADGPRNVVDAVRVALSSQTRGVLCVCAGDVHSAEHVQKVYSHALNAFSSGDHGVVAQIQAGKVLWKPEKQPFYDANSPLAQQNTAQAAIELIVSITQWPRVEIVHNYASSSGALVRSLLADRSQPLRGIVAAGTGNGTLSRDLEAALLEAQKQGVQVLRSTRCVFGSVTPVQGNALACTPLTPLKARIAMTLQLLKEAA